MSGSDSGSQGNPLLSVAITPVQRGADGLWERSMREAAHLFLVELVQDGGDDAEVVVECTDARSAAFAARVVAATIATLGLAEDGEGGTTVSAFDDDTALLLVENPTPEVNAPAGSWVEAEDEQEDEEPAPDAPPR